MSLLTNIVDVIIVVNGGAEDVSAEEQEERRKDELHLQRGVKKLTAKRYSGDDNSWTTFLALKKYPERLQLDNLPTEEQRRLVVRFIRYLFEEMHLPAHDIATKLSALQFKLKSTCRDINIFSDPTIALARKGTLPSARAESLRKSKRKRMPVTLDMTQWHRGQYWRYPASKQDERSAIDDRMTYIGVVLAFAFLWRISQYVLDSQCADHAIMTEDINIFMRDKSVRFPWEMRGQDPKQVVAMLFVSHSSKNDKAGRGAYLYLQRKSPSESELLETVVEWCIESGVQKGDPLLCRYCQGRRKLLTRQMVNTSLKVMAAAFGYESLAFAFSSHSLRIGGATTMISAGVEKERVRRLGGWAEGGCEEIYELSNPLDDNALSINSTCYQLLTSADVDKLLPPEKRSLLPNRLK